MIVVEALLEPYLFKFFNKRFKLSRNSQFSSHDTIGKIIKSCLQDNRDWKYESELNKANLKAVKIVVGDLTGEIPSYRINRINIDVRHLFLESMVNWTDAQLYLGHPLLGSCKSFLAHYSITEEEYKLGSAYKHIQRHNKKGYGEGV